MGRIALVRQKEAAMHARLTEAGGAATWAETLLFGVDHAELGARILESWRFPEPIVEAVRFHHRPAESESAGAAALYAAEFWLESDEDLPSMRQLQTALSRNRDPNRPAFAVRRCRCGRRSALEDRVELPKRDGCYPETGSPSGRPIRVSAISR